MKILTALLISTVMTLPIAAKATGQEELCSRVAESDVKMKNLMMRNSAVFEAALSNIENMKPAVRKAMREKLFFIHNRLHLPDETFKRLTFLRCITDTW